MKRRETRLGWIVYSVMTFIPNNQQAHALIKMVWCDNIGHVPVDC